MGHLHTVEGEVLGFVAGRHGQTNRCRLHTPAGDLLVKFPREWAARLSSTVQIGDRVQVRGKLKFEQETGDSYLKADVFLHLKKEPVASSVATVEGIPTEAVLPAARGMEPAALLAPPTRVLVCKSSDCCKRGARQLIGHLEEAVERYGLADQVRIETTGCMKRCKQGPNMVILPQKTRHTRVKPQEAPELLLRELLPKLE